MKTAYSKYTLILLLILIGGAACAQIKFRKGDEFQRQILTKSNCVLQRGSQTLHVTSSSTWVKTYKVADATASIASFIVTTNKLIDTINAMDQNLIYHSDKPADPNSIIQTGLQKIVNIKSNLSVNQKGKILSVRPPIMANDTLLSFAGIQPDYMLAGTTLQFMIDFNITPALKKGYSWTSTNNTTETTYTIHAINARTTTITYKTSVLGGNLNSRINGSILINNNTGVILKRYAQSVSTGYEMVNGVVYTATRRTAITEVNSKK